MEPERIYIKEDDPANHTAAFKIFNYRFHCSVQNIHLHSEKVIREGGIPSSGIREIDRAAMQAFVPCYMTIAAMAMYADEGVPIRLADSNDAVKISQIIQQHLEDHLRSARYDINKVKVPVDELRMLDALAEKVHPISANVLRNRSPQESEFFRKLREFGGRGLISKLPALKPTAPSQPSQQEGYRSMTGPLTEAMGQRNKPWLNK